MEDSQGHLQHYTKLQITYYLGNSKIFQNGGIASFFHTCYFHKLIPGTEEQP